MRGLAIGVVLTLLLILIPGGHLLLVLLLPLAFLALLVFRTTWQPAVTTYSPGAGRTRAERAGQAGTGPAVCPDA